MLDSLAIDGMRDKLFLPIEAGVASALVEVLLERSTTGDRDALVKRIESLVELESSLTERDFVRLNAFAGIKRKRSELERKAGSEMLESELELLRLDMVCSKVRCGYGLF